MPEPILDGIDDDFCYVVTRGRVTGREHEIEIWFAAAGSTLYLLSGAGDRADWVRNAIAEPTVTVRLHGTVYRGRARVVVAATEEDALARALVFDKYTVRGHDGLDSWRERALPVAIDVRQEGTVDDRG